MKITIGKPIANTQIYIVDKYMQIVPIGVTGELCIAGEGVGAGYLNRPELTAERFVDNPFGKGKLYRTGDLAYWREDGNIVYVGRNDFQVKIRGLRIELGEIENAVSGIEGIMQAAVAVRKDSDNRQLICAFYTGREYEPCQIRSSISQTLPQYMLPHIIIHLDRMPLTASGKIDRKSLPVVNFSDFNLSKEYVMPLTEREKLMVSILERILGVRHLGITDDFFNYGCDSLRAIEFVSACHFEGIYFNLQAVFDHRTIQELTAYIDSTESGPKQYSTEDFSEINSIISHNKINFLSRSEKKSVGNLLLTGVTGYLGAHILADFLDNDTGRIFCIIRGSDNESCRQRLDETLKFYFGHKYNDFGRISVFCGDITKIHFGLSDEDYQYLSSNTDSVIHAAASVKHYGSYQFFYEMNVKPTKQVIEFCQASKCKMIYISSTSIAVNGSEHGIMTYDKPVTFSESDFYIGQSLENVYVRSKFEAEKEVLEAMKQGLQANIMRMGNLTNRIRDGKFQKNYETNAFLHRIKAFADLGEIPLELLTEKIKFTPVDEAAGAVMVLLRHFRTDINVFHIDNPTYVPIENVICAANKTGIEIKAVDTETFVAHLRQTRDDPVKNYIFDLLIKDMDNSDHLHYEGSVVVSTDFSRRYLHQLGFDWTETNDEYLEQYFSYFKANGYLSGGNIT